MINFEFTEKCYACSACAQVCPVKAISYDEELHPVVDLQKCIKCDGCERICIELNRPEKKNDMNCVASYVAKNKDEEIRKMSSSGGVFFQIAESILEIGGYVCGCIYDDSFMPKHVISNDIEVCKKMMGSKYVQSDLGKCITNMKRLVKEGKIVLFTGVPCQIAAVKRCIQNSNLITLAVVCHGSIERRIWQKYINEEIEMSKSPIIKVTMRDKTKGYLNYGLKFQFKDGTEHVTYRKQDGYFLKCFTDGLFERQRCLNCVYKGGNIKSDLLLGDAWGIEKMFPEFVDELGSSSVLILTQQGKEIFDKIAKSFEIKKIDSEIIIRNNPRIMLPSTKNVSQDKFKRKLNKSTTNIHVLSEKYAKPTILNRIKWKITKE